MKSVSPLNFAVLSLTMFLATGCGKKDAAPPATDAFPVKVEPVRRQTIEDVLSLVGTLKAKDEATLYSRVPGKLLENLVREGDRVKKGQAVALVQRDEVGVRYEPAPVPSTLDGMVGRVYLDRGAEVALNTPVVLVVDDSRILVRAEAPERYSGRLSVGQPVRVRVEAYPDQSFSGRIARMSPVVDPATRAVWIEVSLNSSLTALKSGMFATLTIVTGSRRAALAVPTGAVLDGGETAVFVAQDGKARRRPVTLGLRSETMVEVLSGLEEGDPVIVFGLYGLEEGSPVEVLPPPSAPE